jgi:uncharacterized protein YbcC (UPF0753/DUF2309 family)
MNLKIINAIDEASGIIGNTWPLYSFVASNPLSGYEDKPFDQAVGLAEKYFNANSFPGADVYRNAFENKYIDKKIVAELLEKNGFFEEPEVYLNQLRTQKRIVVQNQNHEVDRIMTKWLAAFLDEGLATWTMPFKDKGFYAAWRELVIYDSDVNAVSKNEIPETPMAVIEAIVDEFSENNWNAIFKYHLAALPGWTGYIKHRKNSNSDWQQQYSLTLVDYLAVRLWTCKNLNKPILPESTDGSLTEKSAKLQYVWLQAWEKSYQIELIEKLTKHEDKVTIIEKDVQLVFCIDTRSELIRRHVESKGNYETFGYAGFFGIAMDYKNINDGITRKSCPPIVSSAYVVSEAAQKNKEQEVNVLEKRNAVLKFTEYLFKRMKNMLPSAFGYVEGSGLFYGFGLIVNTSIPRLFYKIKERNTLNHEDYCQTILGQNEALAPNVLEIPLSEKVSIVKSAFNLMGWKQFAPLVVFVGHGSHTTNNPFSSSLDCGACAASPGRHNARMLASLANLPEVKKSLQLDYGILIPDSTIFIGGEHNTTTDKIILFDSEVPETHQLQVTKLKVNLSLAQTTATQERLGDQRNSVKIAQRKASDWGETRPEWGLAKNAGFVIGPRSLSQKINLDSRCFLHSYDWKLDHSGNALESIMQGPMVVTQWINNHYYFSTIDNETYGGGTKITHNVTGKYGVVQGNGSDLKMGLPLQSLFATDEVMYHQPLRLSVLIQAPISRVSEILLKNDKLKSLLDNKWIYLLVMDPKSENETFMYESSLQWVSTKVEKNVNSKTVNKATLEVVV